MWDAERGGGKTGAESAALHGYEIEENVVMHNESFDSEESTAATASAQR